MAEQSDSLKDEMSELLRADRERAPKPNPVVAPQPPADEPAPPADDRLRGKLRRLLR